MTLGQLLAIGSMNERKMGETWKLPTTVLEDGNHARGVWNVIRTSNDLRDFHVVVVHHDRQQVCRSAVPSQNNEIVDVFVWNLNSTHHAVVPGGDARVVGCLDPHHGLHTRRGHKIRAQITALSRIAEGDLVFLGLCTHCVKGLFRAIAFVGSTTREELMGNLLVPFDVPALSDDFAIVRAAQPTHALDDGFNGALIMSFCIGVLDTELELAAMAFRVQIAEECGAGPPDVQIAGW
mmetsp:Transcript_23492/g.65324  ORF Transcript_23492/g.65324 Transcript_23492/m.65324 type:complete len:236 (-) Transcript_23492:240-947(-)